MITLSALTNKGEVWFVYDGDCPICARVAQAVRIREAVGQLHLIYESRANF